MSMQDSEDAVFAELAELTATGRLIPYLGPEMLGLCATAAVPAAPETLVARLTEKTSVPGKIRGQLTRAAQFIENFKHRKTLVTLMREAYAPATVPSDLHRLLAAQRFPLLISSWYDDVMAAALAERHGGEASVGAWGCIQGLSQSEHFGRWTRAYAADGRAVDDDAARRWAPVLYQPLGAHAPADNYLVSDSDFVEVLTEIDIQTPIPALVQELRSQRHFLFLGCRFNDQLARSFARQIMKRSSQTHWAVLAETPTRMEARFLEEQGIRRIALPLSEFAACYGAVLDVPAQAA